MIFMNGQGDTSDSSAVVESSDVATLARLSIHVKENNIAYLIAVAVCYQIGILDKVFAYGSGVCG